MTAIIQRSFSAGEIGPALYARADLSRYATALRTMRNCFSKPHGGAASRAGLQFIGEVKDSSKTVRLLKFVFNSSQTYVLEFGDAYMRVIKSGAYVTLTAQNITGITNASPAVLTYSGADTYANGDHVVIAAIAGPLGNYLNGRTLKVANVNTGNNTFELQTLDGTNVNSTSWGAWTSGGTVSEVYEVVSPYATADLAALNFVQSADTVTIVHPSYAIRELTRSADTSWSFSSISMAPTQAAPTNLAVDGSSASESCRWVVTAVNAETGEESLASTHVIGTPDCTAAGPRNLTWTAASGAGYYNVYRKSNNNGFGYVGTSDGTGFYDAGGLPDTTKTAPAARDPFSGSSNYPSAVTYAQQRRFFANTNNAPEKVWGSKPGLGKNFCVSRVAVDDDAVTFSLAGREVNSIKHLMELDSLVPFTSGGEWRVQGDNAGIITPTSINARQQTYNGSTTVRPLSVNATAVYLQARGNLVRDLLYDFQIDGYRGNDLTLMSPHLFENYTITDWDYAKIPDSIIWAVRSDGTLLGLTYLREQEVLGWHHHDTSGTFENIISVPEGTEDYVYVVVKRTVGGATKRYVERMYSRVLNDIVDFVAMDAALTYDGRNTTSHTMTLSGGSTWVFTETLTLTASANTFASTDVGKQVFLTGSDGSVVRFTIDAYSSAQIVTGRAVSGTVPTSLRATATTTWSLAVSTVYGLWHLEGKAVSVSADGYVVGNPNDSTVDTYTVSSGSITLPKCYATIHVGLPYICDLETLDIENVRVETLTSKKKLITSVSMALHKTRGLWIGPKPPTSDTTDPLEFLRPLKLRYAEDYGSPIALKTGVVEIDLKAEWNSNGRVFIRQIDPLPMTVLSIVPEGVIPLTPPGGA